MSLGTFLLAFILVASGSLGPALPWKTLPEMVKDAKTTGHNGGCQVEAEPTFMYLTKDGVEFNVYMLTWANKRTRWLVVRFKERTPEWFYMGFTTPEDPEKLVLDHTEPFNPNRQYGGPCMDWLTLGA